MDEDIVRAGSEGLASFLDLNIARLSFVDGSTFIRYMADSTQGVYGFKGSLTGWRKNHGDYGFFKVKVTLGTPSVREILEYEFPTTADIPTQDIIIQTKNRFNQDARAREEKKKK